MPTLNMTARWLETIKPPAAGRIEYHDKHLTGLALRVTANGRRSWCAVYRVEGNSLKRRYTLGPYPAIELAEARKRARAAIAAAARGEDPAAAKRAVRQSPTFGGLADEYLKRHASQKKSGDKDRAMLENDALPTWRNWKAMDVKQRDVIELLDKIVDRGAPIQANRMLAVIRKVFNFGIARALVEFNPCAQVKAPAPENQRSRVLTDAEIKAFWVKLDTADMAEPTRRALRLVLVTAQRPGEVATMARAELDGTWWTIPMEKAKNGLTHRVPLSDLAIELIQPEKTKTPKKGDAEVAGGGEIIELGASGGADSRQHKTEFVFRSPRGKGRIPIDPPALSHAIARHREHFGIAHFTPHDLRRTTASRMTGLGISRLVVSKILNHKEAGITAVYDRHSYDREKADALDRWARELRAILADEKRDNVIALRQAS